MRSRSLLKPFSTSSTFYSDSFIAPEQLCQRSYLIQKSNLLMNDIHCVQGQKSYYQNQLQTQLRNNTQDKQRLLKTIADKSYIIIGLEEQLERQRKQIRLITDDYLSIKTKLESERNHYNKQIEMLKSQSEQLLKELKQKLEAQHLEHIQKVIAEINDSCEKKLKLKDQEIQIIKSSRESIGMQLQKSQQQYRLLLTKQNGIASQQLHNQLRKRDREERDRYNLDNQYKQSIKKQNRELKEELKEKEKQLSEFKEKLKQLKSEVSDLKINNQELENTINKNRVEKNKQKENVKQTRNQQQIQLIDTIKMKPGHVPQLHNLPILDLELMASLQSLKQFLDQSMMEILIDLFQKSSSQSSKSKSSSFTVFELNLIELKKEKRELSLIIYASLKIKQILKQNFPSSQFSDQPLLTSKENFIMTCLQQAEALKNKPNQQLYRLLELVYRIRNPINHSNSLGNLSQKSLCSIYDKAVQSGSKVFY